MVMGFSQALCPVTNFPLWLLPVNATQVIKNAVLETLMDNLNPMTKKTVINLSTAAVYEVHHISGSNRALMVMVKWIQLP